MQKAFSTSVSQLTPSVKSGRFKIAIKQCEFMRKKCFYKAEGEFLTFRLFTRISESELLFEASTHCIVSIIRIFVSRKFKW